MDKDFLKGFGIGLGLLIGPSFLSKNPSRLKNPLSINDQMKAWAQKNAHALITINPKDFLKLTTQNDVEYLQIIADEDDYDDPLNFRNTRDELTEFSFLRIDKDGVITDYEGRNKAAKLINNSKKSFKIALILEKPNLGFPNRIIGVGDIDYFIAMPSSVHLIK